MHTPTRTRTHPPPPPPPPAHTATAAAPTTNQTAIRHCASVRTCSGALMNSTQPVNYVYAYITVHGIAHLHAVWCSVLVSDSGLRVVCVCVWGGGGGGMILVFWVLVFDSGLRIMWGGGAKHRKRCGLRVIITLDMQSKTSPVCFKLNYDWCCTQAIIPCDLGNTSSIHRLHTPEHRTTTTQTSSILSNRILVWPLGGGSDLLTSHRLGGASAPLILEGGGVPTADAENKINERAWKLRALRYAMLIVHVNWWKCFFLWLATSLYCKNVSISLNMT